MFDEEISLTKRIKTGSDNTQALYITCQNEYYDQAIMLIENGIDIGYDYYNINVEPILREDSKFFEIANLILKLHNSAAHISLNNNKKILSNWHTSIIQKQKVRLLEHLSEYGPYETCSNNYECYPLIEAAAIGNVLVGKLLIDFSPDLNKKNEEHYTALHIACKYGHTDFAKLLIDNFANMNIPDIYGRTAVALASGNGHIATVQLLINCGADLSQAPENSPWLTPIGISLSKKKLDIASLLVHSGSGIDHHGKEIIKPLLATNRDIYDEFMTINIAKKIFIGQKTTENEQVFYASTSFQQNVATDYYSNMYILVKQAAKIFGKVFDIPLNNFILGKIVTFLPLDEIRKVIYFSLESSTDIIKGTEQNPPPEDGYKEFLELLGEICA